MYQVGDFIIYGSNGVCEITHVGPMDVPGRTRRNAEEKLYYTMKPCYINDSSIFTPVDNARVVMRPVMTEKEAKDLVDEIDEISPLEIREDKKRELEYKEAVLSCDPVTLVGMIKTIYGRMRARIAAGKKVTSSDTKYFHIAEENLYGELAISLGREKSDVKNYVEEKLGVEA